MQLDKSQFNVFFRQLLGFPRIKKIHNQIDEIRRMRYFFSWVTYDLAVGLLKFDFSKYLKQFGHLGKILIF